ncbi:MAG: NAD(P)/FAD-dependent oxidoreductase [Actinomycetota bacterium]
MNHSLAHHACLWNDDLSVDSDLTEPERDVDGITCDVVIVGAGFTGLWTAFYLLLADPNLDVTIVEARRVGFGASGRNGGWCSPLLPMSLDKIARLHGRDTALASRRAMVNTVDEVARQVRERKMDCGFAKGGSLDLVRNRPQMMRAEDHVRSMRDLSVPESEVRIIGGHELHSRISARGVTAAVLETESAVLNPGRLTRELSGIVRSFGCRILEGVSALRIEPGRVTTDCGDVCAPRVIRATEAFTPTLSGEKRTVVPLYSLMIATEPLGDDLWADVGLEDRPSFTDGRRILVYGQRTADGRIAFGGRGAPYHFGSRIRAEYDTDARVARHLVDALHDLFPQTLGVNITHHWGGPLAAPRDWSCSIRFDPRTGLGSAGGYVGDGVATANLSGRTLADLVLERESDLIDLPWVHHRSPKWEPEPIRWFAVNGMARLAALADRYENRRGRPARRIDSLVRRVSGR